MKYLPLFILFQLAVCQEVEVEPINGANLYEQNNPYGGYHQSPLPTVKEKEQIQTEHQQQIEKEKAKKDYTDYDEKN